MTLAPRLMANASEVITNISTLRFDNITSGWGGSNQSVIDTPNWGYMLFQIVSVYPDFMFEIGWLLIFSLPFVMMWISHADMTPAAIVSVFFGLYIVFFVGAQYFQIGILFMIVAFTTILWSIWQKRG